MPPTSRLVSGVLSRGSLLPQHEPDLVYTPSCLHPGVMLMSASCSSFERHWQAVWHSLAPTTATATSIRNFTREAREITLKTDGHYFLLCPTLLDIMRVRRAQTPSCPTASLAR
jgi:hypothetical protein